jgi:hypothetical protein
MTPPTATRPSVRRSPRRGRARVPRGPLAALVALVGLLACAPAQPESIDAEHLAGRWVLDTGSETEWFHLDADGTFTADIRRDGFNSTTLSQGPRIELSGRWTLDDRTLSFQVETSDDDGLVGQIHTYEITELTDRQMSTVDAQGKASTLQRGL